MQQTSALYKRIVADENHWYETKLTIEKNSGGVYTITEDNIRSVRIYGEAFPDKTPSVGNAESRRIDLALFGYYDIPKRAKINVSISAVRIVWSGIGVSAIAGKAISGRAIAGVISQEIEIRKERSEWIRYGVYYVDTKSYSGNGIDVTEMTGYDSMILAEQDYPDTSHEWPYFDIHVVQEIASAIGVTVDSRTIGFLVTRYPINLPTGYTMRETLANIAAMYGGNFVITEDEKLLFVPLYGLEPDLTGSYLADADGETALMFGDEGWFILV